MALAHVRMSTDRLRCLARSVSYITLTFTKGHCLFNDTNVVVPGVDPTLSCPPFSFAELNFFGTATHLHLCKLQ